MPSHHGAASVCSSPASTVSMDPSSPEAGSGRSGRQRLRPWLKAQVDSGRHPGLQWVDAERGIFRMTWKHGGRADWCEEDGSIFKAWAVHTGRHREGIDEPDWPCWKTRLRCAINKQKPDILELKDMSCMEEPHPFRVFQFTGRTDSGATSSSQGGSPSSASDEMEEFQFSVQDRPSVIQPNIPTIINDSLDSKSSIDRSEEGVDAQVTSLGSDLQHVSLQDLVPPSSISLTNISVDSNINSYTEAMDTDSLKGAASGQHPQVKREPLEKTDPGLHLPTVSDHEMMVTLRFRNEVIHQAKILNPRGCRVFYGDVPYKGVWDPELFGSYEADQILVPYSCGQLKSAQQDQYTQTVLKGMEHGINLYMDKRNIYLERRCKTRIITVQANKGAEYTYTKKLERRELLKVFDFTQDFLPAFMRYEQGEGPRPTPQVVIAVGQDFRTDDEPYTHLFLSVTVCHAQASLLLSQLTATTTAPEMSHSDNFDHHMNMLKTENATIPIANLNQAAIPETTVDEAVLM